MTGDDKLRVRFSVDDDEQASRISTLLEALGYEPVREVDRESPQTRLRWAVSRLSQQARLTERERDILTRVLHGRVNHEIAEELGISKATVKWHMHNVFTKTGAGTREALLRSALQLDETHTPSAAAPAAASIEAAANSPASPNGGDGSA